MNSPRLLLLLALSPVSLPMMVACAPKIGDACKNSYPDCTTQNDNRSCDLSFTVTEDGEGGQGECTIEDCARGDCPDGEDAVCVKVYGTQFLSVACDPTREDIRPMCNVEQDERCLNGTCEDPESVESSKFPCDPDKTGAESDCKKPNESCVPQEDSICERSGLFCDSAADPWAPADNCAPHEICLREGLCADEISARTSCRRECESDGDCRPAYRCQRSDANGVYVAPDPDDPTAVEITSICVPDQ